MSATTTAEAPPVSAVTISSIDALEYLAHAR